MTQQEVMKTFMDTLKSNTDLSGRAALDAAIKASSKFGSFQELIGQFYEDLENSKNWHTFLVEKCGIILDNADTGAITGSDAGGKEKTATTIMPAKGEAQYPDGDSFTIGGVTIYGIPEKSTLSESEQYVVQGLYSWWLQDSLDLLEESYGLSFTDETSNNARIKLEFMNDPNSRTLAVCSFESDSDAKEYEVRTMTVNVGRFQNVDPSDRYGYDSTIDDYLNRSIVHELTHGIMAANLKYLTDLPTFLLEGGTAELVGGIDDTRRAEIIQYAGDTDGEVFQKILGPEFSGSIKPDETYSGGYIFMRYFTKQAAADTTFDYDTHRENITLNGGFEVNYFDNSTITGGKSTDTVANSGSNVVINTKAGADNIYNYNANVTINSGSGKDYIYNSGNNVSIAAGSAVDTIQNEGSYALINAGAGRDVVRNLSGSLGKGDHTTIYGGADRDGILNQGQRSRIYGDDGDDVILNYGQSSRIYGGNGKDVIVNITLASGSEDSAVTLSGAYSRLYGGDGDDRITNNVQSTRIYGDNGNDTITNAGVGATVRGGAGNDSIINSAYQVVLKGDAGNDIFTLNDTGATMSGHTLKAYGGAGDDFFRNKSKYVTISGGADNDIILNYGDRAMLRGDAGADSIYSSGEYSTISGGTGADTIKNDGVDVSINGGAGNDIIQNRGDHVTIVGGKGNDSITNSGNHIIYKFGTGAGNDTVVGANNKDTLQITSGTYSTSVSGSDLIVNVGTDSITFKNLGSNSILIKKRGSKTKTVSAGASALWAEDNFATADNISAIVQNDFDSVSEFETQNFDSLVQENLITFADK